MALLFSGLYEPRLIGRQESRWDSRDRAILADCRNEAEDILINVKRTRREKVHKRKACNTFPVLERKGDRRTSVESRILYVGIRGSMKMF